MSNVHCPMHGWLNSSDPEQDSLEWPEINIGSSVKGLTNPPVINQGVVKPEWGKLDEMRSWKRDESRSRWTRTNVRLSCTRDFGVRLCICHFVCVCVRPFLCGRLCHSAYFCAWLCLSLCYPSMYLSDFSSYKSSHNSNTNNKNNNKSNYAIAFLIIINIYQHPLNRNNSW